MREENSLDLLFGKIAIKKGFATEEQVKEGLRKQKKHQQEGKKVPKLGKILLQKGYLEKSEVKTILRIQSDVRQKQGEEKEENVEEDEKTSQEPSVAEAITNESATDERASQEDDQTQENNSNLIDCPDCGSRVSKRANSCPECGAPVSTSSKQTVRNRTSGKEKPQNKSEATQTIEQTSKKWKRF